VKVESFKATAVSAQLRRDLHVPCTDSTLSKDFSVFKSLLALKIVFAKENKPLSTEKAGKSFAIPAD